MKLLGIMGLCVALSFMGCSHGTGTNAAADDTPLELTVQNLAGKWTVKNDASNWRMFTVDGKYSNPSVSSGTFEIILPHTVKCKWKDVFDEENTKEYNTTVYKNHIVLNNERFERAN